MILIYLCFLKKINTAFPSTSSTPMFTKHCEFMHSFRQSTMQHIDNDNQITKFQLTHIKALPHNKIIVKNLIKTESKVTFWYWKNNFQVKTPVSQMDILWNSSILFVKRQFVGDDID